MFTLTTTYQRNYKGSVTWGVGCDFQLEVLPFFVGIGKIRYTGKTMVTETGYREIEHTADWELKVWAPNLSSLLETAARGMYALAQMQLVDGERESREFEIPFGDRESLLVDFLAELLYLGEGEGLVMDEFSFTFDGNTLKVRAWGAPIKNQSKEIKAVTYHRLQIRETEFGLVVNLVFDV